MLVSCFDQGDCLFTNTNVVKVNLMDFSAPKTAKQIIFDSVFIPNRGFIYDNDTLSTVYLLADPRATETEFVFQYGERSDTLVLSYSTQTIVLSPDCGSYNYQSDLEVKYSTFGTDRVIITNRRLLTSVQNNIEILL